MTLWLRPTITMSWSCLKTDISCFHEKYSLDLADVLLTFDSKCVPKFRLTDTDYLRYDHFPCINSPQKAFTSMIFFWPLMQTHTHTHTHKQTFFFHITLPTAEEIFLFFSNLISWIPRCLKPHWVKPPCLKTPSEHFPTLSKFDWLIAMEPRYLIGCILRWLKPHWVNSPYAITYGRAMFKLSYTLVNDFKLETTKNLYMPSCRARWAASNHVKFKVSKCCQFVGKKPTRQMLQWF